MMKAVFGSALAAAALLATAPGGSAQTAAQQPSTTLKATHGDWEIRCSVQNPEACAMAQTGNNAQGQPVLQVLLRKTPGLKGPKDQPIAAVMEIIAPIGVFLPAGLAVAIDGKEIGRGVYRYCSPQTCVVAEPLQETFITQMKGGSNAVMTVVGVNGEAANISISLKGFTAGYGAL
jgi:invasion protein IalB